MLCNPYFSKSIQNDEFVSFECNPKAIWRGGFFRCLLAIATAGFNLAFIKGDFSLCFLSHFIHKSKFN